MDIKAAILKIVSRRKNTGDITPENLHKILIVRLDKIGDTLCLLPMIRELKTAYPEVSIDVYAGIHNHFMFKHTTYVNHVYIKYRKRNPIKSLLEIWRMRTNHYDLIIDTMEIKFQKVLSLIAIKATWLIGSEGFVSRHGLKNTDLKLYNYFIPFKAEHMTDYLLSYLQPLGIKYENIAMEFPIGKESYTYAKSFLEPYKTRRLIGLNAETSNIAHSISFDDLIKICRKIDALCDNILIIVFSSPQERSHTREIITNASLNNVILEEGSKNIFDAAALVSHLDVMVSPDTSFIHIASAFNIPTVGIYHNNIEHIRLWGPRSSKHVIVKPVEKNESTQGFSRSEVAASAYRLLENNNI